MKIHSVSLLFGRELIAQFLIDEIVFISFLASAIVDFLVVFVTVHGLARVLV